MPDSKRPVTAWLTATDAAIEALSSGRHGLPIVPQALIDLRTFYLSAYQCGWADCEAAMDEMWAKVRPALDEAQQAQADEAGQGEYPEREEE